MQLAGAQQQPYQDARITLEIIEILNRLSREDKAAGQPRMSHMQTGIQLFTVTASADAMTNYRGCAELCDPFAHIGEKLVKLEAQR